MAVNMFEELVKTALQAQGYFTVENVRFALPPTSKTAEKFRTDPSEIDLVAVKPRSKADPVLAVSCKGHTDPFDPRKIADAISNGGNYLHREAWRSFRELAVDDWAGSFRQAVQGLTGSSAFHHVTVVVSVVGDKDAWCQNADFLRRMKGNALKIWTLEKVINDIEKHRSKLHPVSTSAQLIRMLKAA